MDAILFTCSLISTALAAAAAVRLAWKRGALAGLIRPILDRVNSIAERRRAKRADAQLPEALALLANALKAGLALPQAIELAASEVAAPLGREFALVVAEQRLGRDLDEALGLMRERLQTEDVALFVQSVEVLRRTGGNLIRTFSALSRTIEQRRRIAERVRSLTSQGVAQGVTLLALPWVLVAALSVLAPEFMDPMFQTRLGIMLLMIAVILECLGALWLRSIVVIKV